MPRKVYNKLVRDLIPDVCRAKGVTVGVRTLNGGEFMGALFAKLAEETQEIFEAIAQNAKEPSERSSNAILSELADLDEVVRTAQLNEGTLTADQKALLEDARTIIAREAAAAGFTVQQVEAARNIKYADRGGFEERVFLEWTE